MYRVGRIAVKKKEGGKKRKAKNKMGAYNVHLKAFSYEDRL